MKLPTVETLWNDYKRQTKIPKAEWAPGEIILLQQTFYGAVGLLLNALRNDLTGLNGEQKKKILHDLQEEVTVFAESEPPQYEQSQPTQTSA